MRKFIVNLCFKSKWQICIPALYQVKHTHTHSYTHTHTHRHSYTHTPLRHFEALSLVLLNRISLDWDLRVGNILVWGSLEKACEIISYAVMLLLQGRETVKYSELGGSNWPAEDNISNTRVGISYLECYITDRISLYSEGFLQRYGNCSMNRSSEFPIFQPLRVLCWYIVTSK